MAAPVQLQFRPSLIICVGDSGAQIRAQVSQLLTGLDVPLQPGIALLQVAEDDLAQAVPYPAGDTFPPHAPTQPDSLAILIEQSLEVVQGLGTLQGIADAGYAIPDRRTHIYIVGHARSQTVAAVLAAVRETLQTRVSEHLIPHVFYVLSNLRDDAPEADDPASTRHPRVAPLPVNLMDREAPAFCLLFERMVVDKSLARPEETYYGAATGLFALIATGMSAAAAYQEMAQLRPHHTDYADHLGSLGVSIIRFPRAEVRQYCAATLGAQVLSDWAPGAGELSAVDRDRCQAEAQQASKDLRAWLKDAEPRPGTSDLLGPTLHILRPPRATVDLARAQLEQDHLYKTLNERATKLFQPITGERISEDLANDLPWDKLAYGLTRDAGVAFGAWERAAAAAWPVAADLALANTKRAVAQIWLNHESGVAQARTYVDTLDNRLGKLAETLVVWRGAHRQRYAADLAALTHRAEDGPWIDDLPEESSAPKAAPTSLPNRRTSVPNPAQMSAPMMAVHALPVQEARVADLLRRRTVWLEEHAPSVTTLTAVSLLATPTFALLALAVAPAAWLASPLAASILTASIAVLLGGAAFLVHFLHRRAIARAYDDLAALYARYYAHLCEQREDDLRCLVVGPLRRHLQRMRERLDDMQGYFSEIAGDLRDSAEAASDALFSGPPASRDVFIANGDRLRKTHGNTLADVAAQIDVQRQAQHSMQAIRELILVRFRQNPEGLFDLSSAQIQQHVRTVTQGIIDTYLTGDLVDINAALQSAELWREAQDRASKVLYHPHSGALEPLWFVCGRDRDRARLTLPAGAIPVQTVNPEWLLVVQFVRGGDPSVLDLDTLFPHKGTSGAAQLAPVGAHITYQNHRQ